VLMVNCHKRSTHPLLTNAGVEAACHPWLESDQDTIKRYVINIL
jgi:hypothetical protein